MLSHSASCNLLGAGDLPFYRARCRNGRARKIDLAFWVAHPSHEVSVSCRHRPLTFCQNTHVAPEAGSACRRRNDATCLEIGLKVSAPEGSVVNIRSGGYHDTTHVPSYLPPF